MRVGAEAAKGELDRVGFPHDNRELAAQRPHQRPLALPRGWKLAGAAGEDRQSGDTIDILNRDRDALQPAKLVARGEGSVGCLG
jgi:hypothetical protein